MSAKHTPGPWEAVRANPSPTTGAHLIRSTAPDAHGYLADVREVADGNVVAANARLVAAAPLLLEALKSCAAVCAGQTMSKSALVDALEQARAAIASATGETA